MKKLWAEADVVQLSLLRSELDAAGISYVVNNENLAGVAGEVPFTNTIPEIWVVDERRMPEALDILTKIAGPEEAEEEAEEDEVEEADDTPEEKKKWRKWFWGFFLFLCVLFGLKVLSLAFP